MKKKMVKKTSNKSRDNICSGGVRASLLIAEKNTAKKKKKKDKTGATSPMSQQLTA
jgi:hypothetical protein